MFWRSFDGTRAIEPTTSRTGTYMPGMVLEKLDLHESDAIAVAAYDRTRRILRITFKAEAGADGGTYDHLDVPEDVVEELTSAESHGRFVNRRIKPRYEPRKVI